MYKITPELLREIAGAPVNKKVADALVTHLPEALEKYKINTKLRLAHFLAQLAHESDHFRTFEEYASGAAYEGRRDLGNVVRGDGRRYKGRGPIQVTGRYNYKKYGDKLGVNLIDNPELAASPRIGTLIAGQYWHDHKLNDLADADNGKFITRRINGGYNGLKDRLAKVERAKRVLDKYWVTETPVVVEVEVEKKTPNTETIVVTGELPIIVKDDLQQNIDTDLT